MAMKREIKQQIKEIIEQTNFTRIHKHMKHTGWEWATLNPMRTPSEDELIASARKLLEEAYREAKKDKSKWMVISTGGFYAFYFKNEGFTLLFSIS